MGYEYHRLLTGDDLHPPKFLTGTTDPTESGGPTPSYVGQIYFDTVGSVAYISNGTSNNSDWQMLVCSASTTKIDLGNQDVVTTGTITSTYQYFGDANTNGSWRFYVSGTDLVVERREAGSWVEKGAYEP